MNLTFRLRTRHPERRLRQTISERILRSLERFESQLLNITADVDKLRSHQCRVRLAVQLADGQSIMAVSHDRRATAAVGQALNTLRRGLAEAARGIDTPERRAGMQARAKNPRSLT